ncbi:hypothetical protein QBC37DRAFT_115231 [Rhypophila decipiens]|uniref:Uncharacterized protein n=1 Tax=Rhypophila decipiens TaxID=261697 RepID=A0AAN6YGR0_9PEZI|nr:hypothetical protein QBC37DRAFT_115231 [Rhypophila decipiens]
MSALRPSQQGWSPKESPLLLFQTVCDNFTLESSGHGPRLDQTTHMSFGILMERRFKPGITQCMVSLTSCFITLGFLDIPDSWAFNVVATRLSYVYLHLGPSPFDAVYTGCGSPSLSLSRLTTICLVDQILMELHFPVLWFFVGLICAVWNERATLSRRLSILSEFLSLPSGLSWSSSLVYWVFGCGICLIWCYFPYFVCCEVS